MKLSELLDKGVQLDLALVIFWDQLFPEDKADIDFDRLVQVWLKMPDSQPAKAEVWQLLLKKADIFEQAFHLLEIARTPEEKEAALDLCKNKAETFLHWFSLYRYNIGLAEKTDLWPALRCRAVNFVQYFDIWVNSSTASLERGEVFNYVVRKVINFRQAYRVYLKAISVQEKEIALNLMQVQAKTFKELFLTYNLCPKKFNPALFPKLIAEEETFSDGYQVWIRLSGREEEMAAFLAVLDKAETFAEAKSVCRRIAGPQKDCWLDEKKESYLTAKSLAQGYEDWYWLWRNTDFLPEAHDEAWSMLQEIAQPEELKALYKSLNLGTPEKQELWLMLKEQNQSLEQLQDLYDFLPSGSPERIEILNLINKKIS